MKEENKNQQKPEDSSVSARIIKMPAVETGGRFKTKNKKHCPNIIKTWNIQDFDMNMLHVQVAVCTDDGDREIEVCRPCFEQWLSDTGRLDWYMAGFDDDIITEYHGTMAVDDYWENAEYEVKMKDLRNYLLAEKLVA